MLFHIYDDDDDDDDKIAANAMSYKISKNC